MGGFWERLVQSTKRILRKSFIILCNGNCATATYERLNGATATYEEPLTFIVEIEVILNCRPITYVYHDEFSEPLTPSYLIYRYRILSSKSINDQKLLENEQVSTSNSSKRMKY